MSPACHPPSRQVTLATIPGIYHVLGNEEVNVTTTNGRYIYVVFCDRDMYLLKLVKLLFYIIMVKMFWLCLTEHFYGSLMNGMFTECGRTCV